MSELELLKFVVEEFKEKAMAAHTAMMSSETDAEFAPNAARYTGYSAATTAVEVQYRAMEIQMEEIAKRQQEEPRIIS